MSINWVNKNYALFLKAPANGETRHRNIVVETLFPSTISHLHTHETFVAKTLFVSEKQIKMFLIFFRNIFFWQQMLPCLPTWAQA